MRVAIVGGGVAGSTIALILSRAEVNCTLFDSRDSLISGPPFCHLHAGGNLYREISDKQCITLLKQSIEFAKLYPFIVDHRPTIIATPIYDEQKASNLYPRLKLLQNEYRKLITSDPSNKLLGEADDYFKLYSHKELEKLSKLEIVKSPKSLDEWMIPFAKNVDKSKIQEPVILVQEYGLNLFRLSAGLNLELKNSKYLDLRLHRKVKNIKKSGDGFMIEDEYFDYLINATGFRSGEIDDILDIKSKRMVEFKAAYISKCDTKGVIWPEVIFHGKRGTPKGMGQFTPYPNGYFQLHAMSKKATLFEDGLAKNSFDKAQPQLKEYFIKKIDSGWEEEIVKERTNEAIKHLSQFIPNFQIALSASKPLYGAQQIPGDDPKLRVAEVSFPLKNYARCEIVKVSSVIDMAKEILKKLNIKKQELFYPLEIDENLVSKLAQKIAIDREYPKELATMLNPKEQKA